MLPATSRVMVTGVSGFIGSRLAHRLLDLGHEVCGADAFTASYDPSEKLARAAELVRRRGFRLICGDLADLPLHGHLAGVDTIFHLAGRAGVRASFAETRSYVHDNVRTTRRLLEAARRTGAVRRVVFASSSSVYGNSPLPFRESEAPAPISPYGQTKLEAEQLCLQAHGRGLETVALRYFTVYGPGQRPDMAIRRFIEAMLVGDEITVLGDGRQTRDFTYVDDIVTATMLAAHAPAGGMAVNVGGGSRVALADVIGELERLTGQLARVRYEPAAAGDANHTGADLDRAQALLGFKPSVPVAEGLPAEVDWVRARMDDRARKYA